MFPHRSRTTQTTSPSSAHSVTQTSFDNPCFQLPGGFSSGIHGVQNISVAAPPFWDLMITNVSRRKLGTVIGADTEHWIS
jgi:hypothetical protein